MLVLQGMAERPGIRSRCTDSGTVPSVQATNAIPGCYRYTTQGGSKSGVIGPFVPGSHHVAVEHEASEEIELVERWRTAIVCFAHAVQLFVHDSRSKVREHGRR